MVPSADRVARSRGVVLACQERTEQIKQAESFEYIGEVPLPGGRFASPRLEVDYQFKHPIITTMHPGAATGALIGAAVGAYLRQNKMLGATIGGSLGLGAEGAHRLHYLLGARQQLRAGKSPLDRRYALR